MDVKITIQTDTERGDADIHVEVTYHKQADLLGAIPTRNVKQFDFYKSPGDDDAEIIRIVRKSIEQIESQITEKG